MNIKLMIFDMAGTTINEDNIVYKTIRNTIQNFGVAVDLDLVLEIAAGKEKLNAIQDILKSKGTTNINAEEVFKQFEINLDKAYENLAVTPIKDVEKTILTYRNKGVIIVLNTGYTTRIARLLLNKIGWKEKIHFDGLITADDVKNGRPAPDMIYKAMECFGISDPKKVLKAGDSMVDILEGKNANCGITVGVLSGAQNRAQLAEAKPTFIINSLAELDTFL